MARVKFPKLIHVVEEGEGDDRYFVVHTGGVQDLDEPGQPVAIYKQVKVGRVNILKSFQDT